MKHTMWKKQILHLGIAISLTVGSVGAGIPSSMVLAADAEDVVLESEEVEGKGTSSSESLDDEDGTLGEDSSIDAVAEVNEGSYSNLDKEVYENSSTDGEGEDLKEGTRNEKAVEEEIEIDEVVEEEEIEENGGEDSEVEDSISSGELNSSEEDTEGNFSFDTARTLSVNTPLYQKGTKYEYEYFYVFTLPSQGYVDFTYKSSTSANLTLYDSNRITIFDRKFKSHTNEPCAGAGLRAGTYYIMVDIIGSATDFEIEAHHLASKYWEAEWNDTAKQANSIDVGSKYGGIIMNEDDVDVYKFSIPNEQIISVWFDQDDPASDDTDVLWRVGVYKLDASGKSTLSDGVYHFRSCDSNVETTGKKLSAGTYYVVVSNGPEYYNDDDSYYFAIKKVNLNLPESTSKVSAEALTKGFKISWKKVNNATGYYVYRNNKIIATIKSGKTVSYTDKKANTNGVAYTYSIQAYNRSGKSRFSKSISTYRLSQPKITKLANSSKGKALMQWKKNSKAGGYEIMYSTSSRYKSGNKKTDVNYNVIASQVIKKLKRNKTYYFRIRSYKTVGGTKCYSAWSKVSKLKVVR